MEERITSFLLYGHFLGNERCTSHFGQFCVEHNLDFNYIQKDNKNSELFQGSFVGQPGQSLSFFGKRMPMIPDDFDALNERNRVSVTKLLDPNSPYTVWREIFIHKLLNQLLLNHQTPHFPFFYGYHFSYDNDVFADQQERPYILLLQEKMDEDLKTWATRQTRTEEEWFSCLVQLFFALGTLHRCAGLSHMDMHWGNVLVKKLPNPKTWTYRLSDHEHYSLVDQEYLFTVCDFGCAQFEVRDEMKDYRKLALNVFKWLQQTPGEKMDRFLAEIHALRNRRWKDALDLVVSKHTHRALQGEVYDMRSKSLEYV